MQRLQILLCTYSLFLWSHWCLAKRRGSGSDDSGGGNSGGGGSYDDDDNSGSSGGGSVPYEPPCISCECRERDQRIRIFSLPGSYYNGSVTVNHIVSTNSARDAAIIAESQIGCNSNDASPKNYTYLALFTVGSNLNGSDTNPIFWNLRAFNPPNEYTGGESNIFAEWIHVLSSDFATKYWNTGDISSSYPRETHTYWSTNVVATGPSKWAANATYTAQPQQESSVAANFPNLHFVVRSSNYITLADVCAYDQEIYFRDSKIPPISPLPLGNTDTFDSILTIFFDLGAQATLKNIGSNTLKFSMKGSVRQQVVGTGQLSYSCPTTGSTAYYSTLQPCQWKEAYASSDKENMWNISASVMLSFQGTLVTENSTDILPNSTSLPIWDQKSKITSTLANTPSATAQSGGLSVRAESSMAVLGAMLAGLVMHPA